MSKLTEELKRVRVFNDANFFDEKGVVYLSYAVRFGLSPIPSRWMVHRHGFKTDADGPWYDRGSKSFSGFEIREGMTRRASALEDAKEWAGKRYGITEWKRSPFGGWGDAGFVTARLASLKERASKAEAAKP